MIKHASGTSMTAVSERYARREKSTKRSSTMYSVLTRARLIVPAAEILMS